MDCASCMATIRAGLNGQPGFVEMTGSPVSRSLTIAYDEHLTDPEALRRVIGDLGYRAHVADADSPESAQIWRSRRAVLTYVSAASFWPGLLVRILGGEGLASHSSGFGASPGLDGTLFLVAAIVGAWNFLPKAFGALRAGILDMHVLMALAVVGAAAIGEYMEAAAIAFLFSVAELLEGFAVERADHSVRSLMELSPEVARVVRGDREVSAASRRRGSGEIWSGSTGRKYTGGRRSGGGPVSSERVADHGGGDAGGEGEWRSRVRRIHRPRGLSARAQRARSRGHDDGPDDPARRGG